MLNVLRSTRQALGWRLSDLAAASQCPLAALSHAEHGRAPIPRRVVALFAELGLDAQTIAEEHRRFVEAVRSDLVQSARRQGGGTAR